MRFMLFYFFLFPLFAAPRTKLGTQEYAARTLAETTRTLLWASTRRRSFLPGSHVLHVANGIEEF